MAQNTFKGRALLPGNLKGKALVSKQAFNLSGSYLKNLFAGVTDSAPCTDSTNKELYEKDLSGAILCTTQTVGSTLGGATAMGVNELGVGLKAMLFAWHIDSVSAAGAFIDDIWNGRRVITIDNLGDEFLEAVKTGDPIEIREDGTVVVG
jgi:predicted aconitase with swiveling domain